MYKQSTQIPNHILDKFLPLLTEAELKIILVIIRQTLGWIIKATGKRKHRDRISNSQFQQKTGMSKRIITKSIQTLITKELIEVTDRKGNLLSEPLLRKGKKWLYYAVHFKACCSAQKDIKPVHETNHNKTNKTKLTYQKGRQNQLLRIGEIIPMQFTKAS